jgi:uncharacterized membrane protein YccC
MKKRIIFVAMALLLSSSSALAQWPTDMQDWLRQQEQDQRYLREQAQREREHYQQLEQLRRLERQLQRQEQQHQWNQNQPNFRRFGFPK